MKTITKEQIELLDDQIAIIDIRLRNGGIFHSSKEAIKFIIFEWERIKNSPN